MVSDDKTTKTNKLPNSFMKIMTDYFNYYTGSNIKYNEKTIRYISDPLCIASLIGISIFVYIYFAGDFICQVFGLLYPCYCLYSLTNIQDDHALEKRDSLMKFFIIYAHQELLFSALKLIGLYFYHIRFLIIISLLYLLEYQGDLFRQVYETVTLYDKIIISLMSFYFDKIKKEFQITKKRIMMPNKKSK